MNADEIIKEIYTILTNTPDLDCNSANEDLKQADEAMNRIFIMAKKHIQRTCKHDWRFRNCKYGSDYYQCSKCLLMRDYDHTEIGDIMNELAEARDD